MIRLAIVSLLLAACGGPQVDVAPEVQSRMFAISAELVGIDRAITAPTAELRQKGVTAGLDRILAITRELSKGDLRRSHPLMENEIDGFLADVDKARVAAAAEPPNYYWAGRLHAACVRCHDPEGGIWK